MRKSAVALVTVIATFSVGMFAGPALAAPAHSTAVVDSAARHPIVKPVPGAAPHMGHYTPGQFAAGARKLPSGLTAQLQKQLGISPEQFLADGQAAADASKVIANLRGRGVDVTGSRMNGTALTVYVPTVADAATAQAAGATAIVGAQPKPSAPLKKFKADAFTQKTTSPGAGTSPLIGGDGWWYADGAPTSGGGFYLSLCSVGFLGYDHTSGAREFATAGHCADYQDTGGTAPSDDPNGVDGSVYSMFDANPNPEDNDPGGLPLDYQPASDALGVLNTSAFKFGGGDDYGTVPVTDSKAKPANEVTTWGGASSSTSSAGVQNAGTPVSIIGDEAPIQGSPICHSGDRTGWQCGTIQQAEAGASLVTDSGATQEVDGFISNAYVCSGDSGGSMITGQYAVGTVTGGSWYEPNDGSCLPESQSAADKGSSYDNDTIGFPLVSPAAVSTSSATPTPSFAADDPSFELGVVEPTTTPAVTADSSGAPTMISGTLSYPGGTPAPAGTPVSLTVDGVASGSTTSAANSSGAQVWQFTLSGLSLARHSYTLTIGSGHSATTQTFSPLAVARDQGADRWGTAVAASKAQFPNGASTVFIASGETYPDALAAAPAAAKTGGDLLLTAPGSVPSSVSAELRRLHPTTVYLIGGTGAISETAAAQVAAATGVTPQRISGSDRYATSAAIVAKFFPSATAVFAATGAGFPDALSGAGAAAGAQDPVLLVPGTSTAPTSAVSAQLTRLHPGRIYVVGGTAVVSTAMQSELAKTAAVTRLYGANRYATSVAVAQQFHSSAAQAVIASGENFPDALVGSVLAGSKAAPLLLAEPTCMPSTVVSEVTALQVASLTLMGGTSGLSAAVGTETKC